MVVGGGIAGLAATAALVERGVGVTVLEADERLGGRVASWPITLADGSTTTMSRGFHAFFRQYYTLRWLLRHADPALARLVPVADYPLVAGDGTRDSFTGIPRTPPFNLLGFVARSPSFTAAELARVNVGEALRLLQVRFPETFAEFDGVSAADFLDGLRFPPKARHLSLEVFARSFFADPGDFSAGELVAMFHTYFVGSAEGLLFDVPDDDFDTALWSPLARQLTALGADLRLGARADAVAESAAGGVRVIGSMGEIECDAVVLATDRGPLRRIVAASEWLGDDDWRRRVASAGDAPPFVVGRLWFARPVRAEAPAFLGTSGHGPLDNISVLERFEAGAARWANATGGSVIEVHAYAAHGAGSADVDAHLRQELIDQLLAVHPELREVEVVDQQWLTRQDCPLVGTDAWGLRPGVTTPDPRVLLAGDGIRCELPVALMERAAVTGVQAANLLLSRAGLPGHDIWTVPMRGLLAGRARSGPGVG